MAHRRGAGPHPLARLAAAVAAAALLGTLAACAPQQPAPEAGPSPAESTASTPFFGRLPTPAAQPTASASPAATSVPTAAPTEPPAATLVPGPQSPARSLAAQHSLTDPLSPWVLVNKHHPLDPLDFIPPDLVAPDVRSASSEPVLLRSEAAAAVSRMFADAAADGVAMTVLSSYRSYAVQTGLYASYAAAGGVAEADTKSARPGYSEHQSGLTLDIGDAAAAASCQLSPCFAQTAAAQWAAANGHRYGFIVRYPLGSHPVTGYYAEPWHLRYVGVELATDLVQRSVATYEEYLGTGSAPDYG
ncbi:M15 family metallopeptidase [Arthrobacter sp. 35W]|uniref:M15 family metallopeptidase n=1 Tax=Arthrobacter sp. 35W TaxID=1132441 RepID=UPI00040A7185|nr:M15 family metallopeptidase [Arthrobacter sp. 35W]